MSTPPQRIHGLWWRRDARARDVYAVAAVVGLVTYVAIYGWAHLTGASAYWDLPQQDERMALIGYRYFLHEGWHWPVFVSHAIDVPYATSVAFNDVIPLWALVNKLVATVLPPWRDVSATAYLGLWHALVYALQACFGVACLRALGHRSWLAAVITSVFVLALPAWIFRYGHAALSAHWIELWALYLYLRTPPRAPLSRRLGVAWIAQLAIASLITPYHPVMSLGVFVASLARARDLRTSAICLPLGLVTVAVATWFAGYFAGEGTVAQWGFDKQSTNALAWLVPVRSGLVGDGRWLANVMATDWQYEGYAYLGAGVLALLALWLPRGRELPAVIRRHAPLFMIALAFFVVALSNHIYVGGHEVATYKVPWFLKWIPGQFRAPGRFVWIPMYVGMLFVLHRGLGRFATGWRPLVLVGLAVLQLLDARGDWAEQRAWTSGPRANVIDRDRWRDLVHAHAAVQIHPTHACLAGDRVAWLADVAGTIELLASERALPINGTYSARTIRRCADEAHAWPRLAPEPDTLYVLLPPATSLAAQLAAAGAHCASFEDARVCTLRRDALDAAVTAGAVTPLRR